VLCNRTVNTADIFRLGHISLLAPMPLPKVLADKKAIANIQNHYEKCLLCCVLAALHPTDRYNKNPQRISHYHPYEQELNTDGISFPKPLHMIERFEKLNQLSINIFGFEDGEVLPLSITSNKLGNSFSAYLHFHKFLNTFYNKKIDAPRSNHLIALKFRMNECFEQICK